MTRYGFIRRRLLAGSPRLPYAIGWGVAFIAIPTLLRWVADPVIGGTAFATYYPFILIAALIIGWRGATVVALVSAAAANYLFIEPRYVLLGSVQATVAVGFFLISCALMILVVNTLQRSVIELDEGSQREAGLNAELMRLNSELQHSNSELHHRVKNTLSVVQAMASHTFRSLPQSNEAVGKFHGRLRALAEAQAVLNSGHWDICHLPDLATRALAPFTGPGAISLGGPPCGLPERSCVPLVLALHELATNAVKYGALSTPAGKVEVQWRLLSADNQDGQELQLDWVEHGGPPVEMPTRRGLGSRLIAPQAGIDAAAMDFRPDGLACRIVVSGALQSTAGDASEPAQSIVA